MKNLLSLCSIIFTVAVVHALPSIEARALIPNPGEECVYHWPEHSRQYTGTVTETNDCKGGVSFWQYGRDANVQCCVREHCTAFSDPDGEYGQYSCLNTYKKEECGGGSGRFIAGHCLGDKTVQCCYDQLTNISPTSYNSPEGYHNGVQQINNPDTDGIVVPTVGGSGTQPSYPTSGNQGVGNNDESGRIPTNRPSEESKPSNYGLQPDGTFVVPTVPQGFETPRDSLEWRIIPGASS